jgi:hypothetical protein
VPKPSALAQAAEGVAPAVPTALAALSSVAARNAAPSPTGSVNATSEAAAQARCSTASGACARLRETLNRQTSHARPRSLPAAGPTRGCHRTCLGPGEGADRAADRRPRTLIDRGAGPLACPAPTVSDGRTGHAASPSAASDTDPSRCRSDQPAEDDGVIGSHTSRDVYWS